MLCRSRLVGALALALAACHAAERRATSVSGPELLPGLDVYHRPVRTGSADAQRWFDQGLVLAWAFNHAEARRSFARAAELDPACAMAFWGMAWAAGPNINDPAMDEERSRAGFEASRRALELTEGESSVERDLAVALSKRYAWPAPEDRRELDREFAGEMRRVWQAHPRDADVGAVFAEALMDLRPWDLWSQSGEPRPETPEVLTTLEAVLAIDPTHPQGLHATIHALEASPNPERALAAADRLRERVPGAGHLLHMPSHIDVLVGRYADAIAANRRAIAADLAYVERAGRAGFYNIYRAHNYHMLAYAAMFDGQSRAALEAARELVSELAPAALAEMPLALDAYVSTPYHVQVRFGLWDEILREPDPGLDLPVTRATRHYARGVALSALGLLRNARAEREALEHAWSAIPAGASLGNNSALEVLAIARAMLEGELEYRDGRFECAFERLREAVRLDDALRYDEPWSWMQPARHALGALLLDQGRLEEAEQVYREDLRRHPANGWSLHGLAESLERQERPAETAAVRAELREAWQRADIELYASCFCRR
jgi:tetratricopeptide (TPR) repeat protein